MELFKDHLEIQSALKSIGIASLTSSQEIFFKQLSRFPSHNICFHAKNGHGKTIGYVLHCLKTIISGQSNRCLVILPTRELAFQVHNLFNLIAQKCPSVALTTKLLVGGFPLKNDIESFANITPNILTGTSGRILQMIKLGFLHLWDFSVIVFDEYDKLFESKEFVHLTRLVKKHRGEFFGRTRFICVSATFVQKRFRLLKDSLRRIKSANADLLSTNNKTSEKQNEAEQIKPDINLDSISQFFIELPSQISARETTTRLVKSLCQELAFKKGLIFYNDKVNGDDLWQDFRDSLPGIEVIYIHGDLLQKQRFKLFNKFRHQDVRLAITTDILSRGIDLENIDVVFNFDLPFNAQTYFHRVGRCGRSGNKGVSFIFLTQKVKQEIEKNWLFKLKLEEFNLGNFGELKEKLNQIFGENKGQFLKANSLEHEKIESNWVSANQVIYDQTNFKYFEEENEKESGQKRPEALIFSEKQTLEIAKDEIFKCQKCRHLYEKMNEFGLCSGTLNKYFK